MCSDSPWKLASIALWKRAVTTCQKSHPQLFVRVVKVCEKAFSANWKRRDSVWKIHLLPINGQITACRKTSKSYWKHSNVTGYAKFIHFIFLEKVQQLFETGKHILHLLFSISSNCNSKVSKITELNMNHES